jgi:hypothetical protein
MLIQQVGFSYKLGMTIALLSTLARNVCFAYFGLEE